MNEAFRHGTGAFPDASAQEKPSPLASGQRVPFVDLSLNLLNRNHEKWLQKPIFYRNPEFFLPSLVYLPLF